MKKPAPETEQGASSLLYHRSNAAQHLLSQEEGDAGRTIHTEMSPWSSTVETGPSASLRASPRESRFTGFFAANRAGPLRRGSSIVGRKNADRRK